MPHLGLSSWRAQFFSSHDEAILLRMLGVALPKMSIVLDNAQPRCPRSANRERPNSAERAV